jgi:PAS domain S-box-containing protein
MTKSVARKVEALILALAALALGFEAGYAQQGSSMLIRYVQALLGAPLTGALLLTAVGLFVRSMHYRVACIVCVAAGAAWSTAGVFETMTRLAAAPGMTTEEVMSIGVACLAFAVLVEFLWPKSVVGYFASATLFLLAAGDSVAALAAIGVMDSTSAAGALSLQPLACAALSAVGLRQLVADHLAALEVALRRLMAPIAIGGGAATLVVSQLVSHHAVDSYARQLGWMIGTSMLVLCATLCAFAVVGAVGEVAAVRRSSTKWRRLLRRQRDIMHSRTTALRRSRALYEKLFSSVPAPVVLTAPSGAILAANPAMLALVGAESEQQLKTMNFGEFHAERGARERLIADWSESDESIHSGEMKLRRLDGELRSALFTSRVVRASPTGEIEHIQGTFTDITDLRLAEVNQRRLEANLRLSQKLESVGRLAAGVAHEINTPMQYIGDNVFFLKESLESLQSLLEAQRRLLAGAAGGTSAGELASALRELDADADVDRILESLPGALSRTDDGIKTINRIVAAMKELAHPGEGAKASTDVNAVINTAITVTRNAHKTVAAVELALGNLPNALTYKNELCQVFINLIVNAAHAIESAQKADRRAGVIKIATRAEHETICIDVSDNGCGIPDSVIDKIFDPFFTTKEVGKGTGQGLALVRTTIVEKHGGQIAVQSAVGQGATFTITIPIGNQG